MRKTNQSSSEAAYAQSLRRAYDAGCGAAADEREGFPPICPYERYEHRKSWAEGLRDGRAAA